MKYILTLLTLLTALLLAPLALHADDAPARQTPWHLGPPKTEHAVSNRALTMAPSITIAPKGRLWATFYAGVTPGEDLNNYVVLSTSGDNGATWQEVLTMDPDAGGPVRAFDPVVWASPDGRLFLFWAQRRPSLKPEVWCVETGQPDAAQPEWSQPRRIGKGVMMCKPLVLSSGEWGLPISQWGNKGWSVGDNSAQLVVSTDAGKTWTLRGSCNVPKDAREADEHMFVERTDGSLWLLVRTRYGIGESVSTDRGKTWPDLTPSGIEHPTSRFFVRRLVSGNLLLVKHGPLGTRIGRSHLTAYLSKDDGKTWSGGLMLDERAGVSYPDGDQSPDGFIRIVYDYNRRTDRNILMAAFCEEDAAAGKNVSGAVKLRQLVSKGSGGQEKPKDSAASANATGSPVDTSAAREDKAKAKRKAKGAPAAKGDTTEKQDGRPVASDRHEIFKRWDANHDGKLSLEEFKKGGKKSDAAEGFKRFDTNHDGELTGEEFVKAGKP